MAFQAGLVAVVNLVADFLLLPDDDFFTVDPLHDLHVLPMALGLVVADWLIIVVVVAVVMAVMATEATKIEVNIDLGLGGRSAVPARLPMRGDGADRTKPFRRRRAPSAIARERGEPGEHGVAR